MPVGSVDKLISLDEFERLPDDPSGWRTELVRGRVVREPPAGFEHGSIAATVCELLSSFVRGHDLGVVVAAETGFVLFDEPPVVRAPDCAFVAGSRLPVGTTSIRGFARLAPDLAVEVISPSNRPAEIDAKVRDYLDAGTRVVWILDPDGRTVRIWRRGRPVEVKGAGDTLEGADVLPGFSVPVDELFGPPAA